MKKTFHNNHAYEIYCVKDYCGLLFNNKLVTVSDRESKSEVFGKFPDRVFNCSNNKF